jgi:deoxyhypusine synthase
MFNNYINLYRNYSINVFNSSLLDSSISFQVIYFEYQRLKGKQFFIQLIDLLTGNSSAPLNCVILA